MHFKKSKPFRLTSLEAILPIEVGPAGDYVAALKAEGLSAPSPIKLHALIDTGFTGGLVVQADCIYPWKLKMRNYNEVHLPRDHGPKFYRSYAWEADLAVRFLGAAKGSSNVEVDPIPATLLELADEGFQAIIGLEVLQAAVFVYNGPTDSFILEFSNKFAV